MPTITIQIQGKTPTDLTKATTALQGFAQTFTPEQMHRLLALYDSKRNMVNLAVGKTGTNKPQPHQHSVDLQIQGSGFSQGQARTAFHRLSSEFTAAQIARLWSKYQGALKATIDQAVKH